MGRFSVTIPIVFHPAGFLRLLNVEYHPERRGKRGRVLDNEAVTIELPDAVQGIERIEISASAIEDIVALIAFEREQRKEEGAE